MLGWVTSAEYTGAFVSAVKQLPVLQDMTLQFSMADGVGATVVEGLLLDLLAGLPALKHTCCDFWINGRTPRDFSPERMHACVRAWSQPWPADTHDWAWIF